MLETLSDLGRTVFSVLAMIIGPLGLIFALYQWIATDFFGQPLKVNGVDTPIGWQQRAFFAILMTVFGCFTALGAWLFSADWVVTTQVGLLKSIPLWAIAVFVFLLWFFVTWRLNRAAGWPELRRKFSRPTGDASFSLKLKWAVMGKGVTCRNVITIAAHEDGVAIAPSMLFGPFTGPVLVPWDQLTVAADQEAAADLIRLSFAKLESAGLTLPLACWLQIEQHRPTSLPDVR
jgi:hypothetical protein